MFRFSHFAAPALVGAALLVGGCASDRPDEVPGTADTVATGTREVKTTATQEGTVYVYDETAHKMIYTGKVEKGDRVEVNAKKNKVMFNDKTAVERDLIDDHHYQVYFDRDPHANDTTYLRDGTVIRESDGKTTIVQPGPRSDSGNVIVQPQAQPAAGSVQAQPAPSAGGSVTVQPQGSSSGVTVQPQGSSSGVTVQPAPAAGQPYPSNSNSTVVQPAPGQTTVVQPAR